MADPRLYATYRMTDPVAAGSAGALSISPYALDLVMSAPKSKFLFIVDVRFKPGFESGNNNKFALLAKTATRPNPKFVTEDISMYGFQMPVVKRTKFDPMTYTFVDDNQNQMMNFFSSATRWMSPIVNKDPGELIELTQYDFRMYSATNVDGINSPPQKTPHSYAMSANPHPFIDSIRLYHVYEYGKYYNLYNFCNPVITELSLDDLDMSSSDGTTLKLVFDYTHYNLEVGKQMSRNVSTLVGETMTRMRGDL